MTILELLTKHMQDVMERIKARKLASGTKADYAKLIKIASDAGVIGTDCDILGPAHFQEIMRVIECRGFSLRTQKNVITAFRTVFNWGGPNGMNFMVSPIYGPCFRGPSGVMIEAQQEKCSPCRFIDREVILSVLEKASPGLKVAVLLGINCGFYQSDSIAIGIDHIDIFNEPPYQRFRRVKTRQKRMSVLWPETVAAISDYIARKLHVASSGKMIDLVARYGKRAKTLLTTRDFKPYSANSGSLGVEFRKISGLAFRVGIGSLRHTFATVIDSLPDQSMIDLAMGHTSGSIQKKIYRQLNLNELPRLSVIAETAHQWLFEGETNV